MKIGDLVKNHQGRLGIVTAIGYGGQYKTYLESPNINPDIHVITSKGLRLWSYRALELISESR